MLTNKRHTFLCWACLLLACSLVALRLPAQEIKVSALLDSSSISIGGQTKIQLDIKYKTDQGDIKIKWPELNDTIIKQIEIVEKSKIDTTLLDKQNPVEIEQHQTITITSFDSGYFAIPPFKFIVNNDTNKIFETEALLLQVNTLAVDTTQAIKDIKGPVDEPFDWKELIPYLTWGGIALAAIAIIVFLFLKFFPKKKEKVKEEKQKLPAHIVALQALEKLQEEKLWQEGKIKQYYSALTDIIRLYIEQRFKVNALEQTSDEIMLNFRSLVVDAESKERLRQIFNVSDLVKFAKEQPLPNENEMCMQNAFAFVKGTLREDPSTSSGSNKSEI